MYLSVALAQQAQKIWANKNNSCSEDLTISSLSEHGVVDPDSDLITRTDTVEVFTPSSSAPLASGSSEWKTESVGTYSNSTDMNLDL